MQSLLFHMKTPLIAILAVSLAANAGLSVYVLRQPSLTRSSSASEASTGKADAASTLAPSVSTTPPASTAASAPTAISSSTWGRR
jgi:hypothetical protein